MASITQPRNSKIRLTPYSQRLLQYSLEDSRVYLSKATNSLLLPWVLGFNENYFNTDGLSEEVQIPTYDQRLDCILDGLITTHTLQDNILEVTIGSGSVIVDSTLLIFPNSTKLSLDLTPYGNSNSTGKVVVSVHFQWLDNINETVPLLKMNYYDPSRNDVLEPNDWWLAQDRLVVTVFDYSKNGLGNVEEHTIVNVVSDPTQNVFKKQIVIKNFIYEIAPLSKPLNQFMKLVRNVLPRKKVHIIPGRIDPVSLPESSITIPIELGNSVGSDLTSITTTMIWNPDIFENFRIEYGPVSTESFKEIYITLDNVSGTCLINISNSLNNNLLFDGILAYVSLDIKREVPSQVQSMIDFNNNHATSVLSQIIQLNEADSPLLFTQFPLPHIVDRPNSGLETDNWDILWKYGEAPYHHANRRQFYANIDISDLLTSDVTVQCYVNNLKITPSGIEHTDDGLIKIWMPDVFIMQENIPDMKVVIIG